MLARFAVGPLSLVLLAACGSGPGEMIGPGPPTGQDVVLVRLFDSLGSDLSAHMPLPSNRTLRIEVRMYGADDHQIMDVPGGEAVEFSFDPAPCRRSTRTMERAPPWRRSTSRSRA